MWLIDTDRCGPERPGAGAKRLHVAEGREGERRETVYLKLSTRHTNCPRLDRQVPMTRHTIKLATRQTTMLHITQQNCTGKRLVQRVSPPSSAIVRRGGSSCPRGQQGPALLRWTRGRNCNGFQSRLGTTYALTTHRSMISRQKHGCIYAEKHCQEKHHK